MPQTGKLRFKIYKDKKGEFRWSLFAKNNKKIANSGEGYCRKFECKKQIKKLIDNIRLSPVRIIVRRIE